MKMPLFPLSSHIMPEGRMSLRIFEPRYVRMIKEACANAQGFVICMLNAEGKNSDNSHICRLGTMCKVIDFDVLEDGLLGVTVEGIECVAIDDIETEKDGLRVGECKIEPKRQCNISIEQLHPIDERLKEIFNTYTEISSLYSELKFDQPSWVINRWLELLPVGAEQKQYFLQQKDCQTIAKYLAQLVE